MSRISWVISVVVRFVGRRMNDLIDTIVSHACANGGSLLTSVLLYVFGLIASASFVVNFRNHLPQGLIVVLDKIALNFVTELMDEASKKGKP